MQKREPYASQEEFNKRVTHYADVPVVELGPGVNAHIVSAERLTVTFATLAPSACAAVHHHEHEQIMVVVDGECDFILEGKLYPMSRGDVIIVPSNAEHGAYSSEKGCQIMDIFSPPRQDFVEKLKKALSSQ
jgi:quercetin dioxygenase-like cupin family protein